MQYLRYIVQQAQENNWAEKCIIAFLVLAVLWRGGKSIDATWLLVGVVAFSVLLTPPKKELQKFVPLELWCAVLLLIVWTVLSYVYSTTANYGYDEVLRTGSLGLLFFWAVRYAQHSQLTQCIRYLSIATLVACGIGVVVYIFQPVNRFVGTFFDYRFHTDYWPNAWANYMLLAWPMIYYWAFSKRKYHLSSLRSVDFILRMVVVAFALSCLFLSYSRGGIIAFGGQLTLWAVITYMQMKDKEVWKKVGQIAVITLAVALLFFQGINVLRSDVHEVLSVGEKITFNADEGASSVSERRLFWGQALTLSFQKPLLGWGPYSFRFVQPHVQKGVLATSDHPHNVFLKYAMERGWIAAVLLLFIIAYVLIKGVDAELKNGMRTHTPIGSLLLISITGVLSHSLIDYNLQFVGIAVPFWIVLGFLAGHVSLQSKRVMPRVVSRYIEVLIALTLLLSACIEGGYLVVSSIGRHAEVAGDSRSALRWYERAKGELFNRDLELSRANILLKEGQYTTAEVALRTYIKKNQQDYRAWKKLGEIYESKKDYTDALDHYEKAYAYGKYNDIGITLGIVRTLLAARAQDVIDSRKDEFDALIIEYGNAIILNSHFIALSPNVEEFVELCELFAAMYIAEAPMYQVLAAKADDHGKLERSKIQSRSPGFLW